MCAALEAGINVVASAPGGLQFLWAAPFLPSTSTRWKPLPSRNSTVFITASIRFRTDLVPFALAGTCQRV